MSNFSFNSNFSYLSGKKLLWDSKGVKSDISSIRYSVCKKQRAKHCMNYAVIIVPATKNLCTTKWLNLRKEGG